MGQVSISIVKRIPFRDSTQEFQNIYTYKSALPNPITDTDKDNMIDAIVTEEKKFHSTVVTFVRASLWSSGGTNAQNNMLRQKALTGTGASTFNVNLDAERAVLVQWPAGVDSKGRPVKLKKWYHCFGNFGSLAFSVGVLQNASQFTSAERTTIQNYADDLNTIVAGAWSLCAESGRERTDGGQPVAHKYLEHHQLGDQWRG